MALINLQTQKPSLRKSIVSSSVFRPSAPIASVAKIPFGGIAKSAGFSPKPLEIGKIDQPSEPSPLYGVVDALRADVQSLRQEQNEAAEIIGDIGNALATDFANRITEEKAQNLLLNKERTKLRRQEKEDNLESKQLFGSPLKGSKSNLKSGIFTSGKGIFGKLFQLLGTLATGIAITNAFKWLEDDKNKEKLAGFFAGMKKHWTWIVGTLGTLVVIDLVSKIALIATAIKGLTLALAHPLVWAGIGILYAAGHQGWSDSQKKALKILEERYDGNTAAMLKDMQIASKNDKEGDIMAKEVFGLHGFGWATGRKLKIEEMMVPIQQKHVENQMGNVNNNLDSRQVGGNVTKDRIYQFHKDEILRAPFTGTVERVGRVKQLLSSGGGKVTVINMPPEVRKDPNVPEIKGDSPVATHVSLINSMNALNPYMIETPSILGITV